MAIQVDVELNVQPGSGMANAVGKMAGFVPGMAANIASGRGPMSATFGQSGGRGDAMKQGFSQIAKQLPGGVLLDNMTKAFSSGGILGVMTSGISGILGFTKQMMESSKVYTTTAGAFFKVFSAMADIFLLPFMPLAMRGIQFLLKFMPQMQEYGQKVANYIEDIVKRIQSDGFWKTVVGELNKVWNGIQNIWEKSGIEGKLRTFWTDTAKPTIEETWEKAESWLLGKGQDIFMRAVTSVINKVLIVGTDIVNGIRNAIREGVPGARFLMDEARGYRTQTEMYQGLDAPGMQYSQMTWDEEARGMRHMTPQELLPFYVQKSNEATVNKGGYNPTLDPVRQPGTVGEMTPGDVQNVKREQDKIIFMKEMEIQTERNMDVVNNLLEQAYENPNQLGGKVRGGPGQGVPTMLHGGEEVIPRGTVQAMEAANNGVMGGFFGGLQGILGENLQEIESFVTKFETEEGGTGGTLGRWEDEVLKRTMPQTWDQFTGFYRLMEDQAGQQKANVESLLGRVTGLSDIEEVKLDSKDPAVDINKCFRALEACINSSLANVQMNISDIHEINISGDPSANINNCFRQLESCIDSSLSGISSTMSQVTAGIAGSLDSITGAIKRSYNEVQELFNEARAKLNVNIYSNN